MLVYEKIKENENTITYEYYPEGKKENKGIVEFDKKTKDVVKCELSPIDEFKRYFFHLCYDLETTFHNKRTVIWY